MRIVSYYTDDYAKMARKLRASCEKLNLSHSIAHVPSTVSWRKNTHLKPGYILDRLCEHNEPVLWVDADAVIKSVPSYFTDPVIIDGIDMGFYVFGKKILAGTLYFGNTPRAKDFLRIWEEACNESTPPHHDQDVLNKIFDNRRQLPYLNITIFPACYIKIKSMPHHRDVVAVIEHDLAHCKNRWPGLEWDMKQEKFVRVDDGSNN